MPYAHLPRHTRRGMLTTETSGARHGSMFSSSTMMTRFRQNEKYSKHLPTISAPGLGRPGIRATTTRTLTAGSTVTLHPDRAEETRKSGRRDSDQKDGVCAKAVESTGGTLERDAPKSYLYRTPIGAAGRSIASVERQVQGKAPLRKLEQERKVKQRNQGCPYVHQGDRLLTVPGPTISNRNALERR